MAGPSPGVLTTRASLEEAMRGGFVSVDDAGDFTFHETLAEVVADFESPNEVACIVDRDGGGHGLRMAAGRKLELLAYPEEIDFAWLGKAWLKAQHRDPRRYPLQRFYPANRASLLATVFECLYMERQYQERGHGAVAVQSLQGLLQPVPGRHGQLESGGQVEGNGLVEGGGEVAGGLVRDPFGHTYRRSHLPPHFKLGTGKRTKNTIFVEIDAPSGT